MPTIAQAIPLQFHLLKGWHLPPTECVTPPGYIDYRTAVGRNGRHRIHPPQQLDRNAHDPWVIRIRTSAWQAKLPILGAAIADGVCDFEINASWTITNSTAFVDSVALMHVTPESCLMTDRVINFVTPRIENHLRNELGTRTLQEWRSLPVDHWSDYLRGWLNHIGMGGAVVGVSFRDAPARVPGREPHREEEELPANLQPGPAPIGLPLNANVQLPGGDRRWLLYLPHISLGEIDKAK